MAVTCMVLGYNIWDFFNSDFHYDVLLIINDLIQYKDAILPVKDFP